MGGEEEKNTNEVHLYIRIVQKSTASWRFGHESDVLKLGAEEITVFTSLIISSVAFINMYIKHPWTKKVDVASSKLD